MRNRYINNKQDLLTPACLTNRPPANVHHFNNNQSFPSEKLVKNMSLVGFLKKFFARFYMKMSLLLYLAAGYV